MGVAIFGWKQQKIITILQMDAAYYASWFNVKKTSKLVFDVNW